MDNHSPGYPPYVILIGDVGTGKSTLVEKMTGQRGRSSDADTSVTRKSEVFRALDASFLVCDTPGANPIEEKFDHNIWIATAMNFLPISRILIAVKADIRIDKVIDEVRKYAEGFLELVDLLGVCVTHMDKVTWPKDKFKRLLDQELGINIAVFSGLNTPVNNLLADTKNACGEPIDMAITSENFLKFFKISNSNVKIMRSTKREVNEFEKIKKDFYAYLERATKDDQVDLIFQFQAWMTEEIIEAQKRVSAENNFSFFGPNMTNEAGHIANMTNQLRTVLYDVRTRALGYQDQHGISQLRRCPHCNLVWAKLVGCDGKTTCGNRIETIDGRKGIMGTFKFLRNKGNLMIEKIGQKTIQHTWGRGGKNQKVGCGRDIEWNAMAIVPVPEEFCIAPTITTMDVDVVPKKAQGAWTETYDGAMSSRHISLVW